MKMKNNISDIMEAYTLNKTENYENILDLCIQDILSKYSLLVVDYMRLVSEKINIKKMHYYKFIFTRGLDTITSVFKILLYLTKNLDLTYYHSQKAFYFYVEFIEQISDDQNIFLQLSSREASLFVYKKTIFEINNEFRKNMLEYNNNENNLRQIIDISLHIYKNIINYCINHNSFTNNNKNEHINICCEKLTIYSLLFNKLSSEFTKDNIEVCYLFIRHFLEKNLSIEISFNLLELFLNKMKKQIKFYENINKNKQVINKIYDLEFNEISNLEEIIHNFFE